MWFWVLVGVLCLVAAIAWCGWKLRELWADYQDELARESLPPDLRAEVDAYRTAERMTWLTARAIAKVRRLR
jgi:hypothetical protein